jgi:CheY-like chemotaxis protein
VGYGTSIHIYLKRVNDDARKAAPKVHEDAVIHTEKKFRTILIVEDNKEVLSVTASMVENLGYTILTAENANDALAILQSRSDIHLLLTDVMLPGALNGPALAKKALEIHPDLKVLFNSGYAEQAIIENGLLEEGVNLLSKPFRKPQMAEKLSSLLGNSPESAET